MAEPFVSPARTAHYLNSHKRASQMTGTLPESDPYARFTRRPGHEEGRRHGRLDDSDVAVPSEVAIPSVSSHQGYPVTRPFIHSDYRRDPAKPLKSYPENNREAVMVALQSLQNKIRDLEQERYQAEDNLRSLATETSQYREVLDRSRGGDDTGDKAADVSDAYGDVSQYQNLSTCANTTAGATDIRHKLDTAEHRCNVLEKQLDYMHTMVQSAERSQSEAVQRAALHQHQAEQERTAGLGNQLKKISELERDHLKLMATQSLSENKIRDLETKLKEEMHYRKIIQEKSAELETAAEANRIILQATHKHQPTKPKKTKKKKKVTGNKLVTSAATGRPTTGTKKQTAYASSQKAPGMAPPDHYKLNMADIPFISGKSITPSHHLAANFQEVLSLMKAHNPKLCASPRKHLRNGYYKYVSSAKDTPLSARMPKNSTDKDLAELLLELQDEFGHMSFEHQELNQQVSEATDSRLQEDLERELDHLVAKMEAKGEQIARLRKHQETLFEKQQKEKKRPKTAPSALREQPTRDTDPVNLHGDIELTTSVKARSKGASDIVIKVDPAHKGQSSLSFYKGLKKIQTTLRKDDLSWDC